MHKDAKSLAACSKLSCARFESHRRFLTAKQHDTIQCRPRLLTDVAALSRADSPVQSSNIGYEAMWQRRCSPPVCALAASRQSSSVSEKQSTAWSQLACSCKRQWTVLNTCFSAVCMWAWQCRQSCRRDQTSKISPTTTRCASPSQLYRFHTILHDISQEDTDPFAMARVYSRSAARIPTAHGAQQLAAQYRVDASAALAAAVVCICSMHMVAHVCARASRLVHEPH